MTDLQEIGAVWKGETVRATRSGRVLALLVLFVMFVSLTLAVVGFVTRQLNASVDKQLQSAGVDATDERMQEQLNQGKKQFLSVVITDDEEMLESLLTLPVVLLFVFKLTLRFVPLFVALMGFDQLAGELGPKSIRFLVVRLKRNNLILGKFASQVTIFTALLFVCTVLMVLVAKALNADFAAKDVVVWTGRLLAASFVLALAYLALTTLCSALVRSGAVSLLLNIMVLFGIWALAFFGEYFALPGEVLEAGSLKSMVTDESPLAYTRYLSVWHYGQDLLHPDWTRFVTAAVVHVGFALVFLGAAQLVMKKRDL
ncbi:MAG: ABC transporter permease subunit [Myxococcaceae bacterium]|nr:ABC transporter permease subunit [Myxococcaceae bacterium]